MIKRKKVATLKEANFLVHKIGDSVYSIIEKDVTIFTKEGQKSGVVVKLEGTGEVKVFEQALLSNFLFEARFTYEDEIDELLSQYIDLLDKPDVEKYKKELVEISNKVLDMLHLDAGDRKEMSLIALEANEQMKAQIKVGVQELDVHFSSSKFEVMSSPDDFLLSSDDNEFRVIVDMIFFWKK